MSRALTHPDVHPIAACITVFAFRTGSSARESPATWPLPPEIRCGTAGSGNSGKSCPPVVEVAMKGDYPRFKAKYAHEDLVEHFLLSPADHAVIETCYGD